jgi:hypothetical protein
MASFSISTTSKEHTFSTYDEDVTKRKHELEGFLQAEKVERPNQKKRRGREVVLNENHMTLRAAMEASIKWEKELETAHGLSDLEVSICIDLMAKYDNHESFPESEPNGKNQKWLDLTRAGWPLMREFKSLIAKYPQENCDQFYRNGGWHLRTGPSLKELEEERDASIRKRSLRRTK